MKHTPTPWYVNEERNIDSGDFEGLTIGNNKAQHVCRISKKLEGKHLELANEDAEFIVRACNNFDELLEAAHAAKSLLGNLNHYLDLGDFKSRFENTFKRLGDVISKSDERE